MSPSILSRQKRGPAQGQPGERYSRKTRFTYEDVAAKDKVPGLIIQNGPAAVPALN
jgi:hypothetical protein